MNEYDSNVSILRRDSHVLNRQKLSSNGYPLSRSLLSADIDSDPFPSKVSCSFCQAGNEFDEMMEADKIYVVLVVVAADPEDGATESICNRTSRR